MAQPAQNSTEPSPAVSSDADSGELRHHERLRAPLGWWLISIFFSLTLVVAVWAYTNAWLGLATAVLGVLVIAVALIGYGSTVVHADEQGLRAGLATIEWRYVAGVEPLDEAAVETAMGPQGDPSAYLLTRPYIKGAVRVALDDAADPHASWLVSTRHPQWLARVAQRAIARTRP